MREHSDILIGLGIGLVAVAGIAWLGKKAMDGIDAAGAALDPTNPQSLLNNNVVTGAPYNGYSPFPYFGANLGWNLGQWLSGNSGAATSPAPETSPLTGMPVAPVKASNDPSWSLGSWIYDVTHPDAGAAATAPTTAAGGATGSW